MSREHSPMRKSSAALDKLEALAVLDAGQFKNRPVVEALFAEIRDLCATARTAERTGDLLALNRLLRAALAAMVRFAKVQRDLDA